MTNKLTSTGSDILQGDCGDKTESEKILAQIETLPPEDRAIVLLALDRYTDEATNNSYWSEVDGIIEFIRTNHLFRDADNIFDLGAGPGQLVTKLARLYPGKKVCGIDLCPGFVDHFNCRNKLPNACMKTGLIDRQLTDVDTTGRTDALSVLTLDRLVYPKSLIKNMERFSQKMLATLLPIVPEDDNPSRQNDGRKIVYTRDDDRIVPGRSAREDHDALLELLEEKWNTRVNFAEIQYVVFSSGDRQAYKLGVFFTS